MNYRNTTFYRTLSSLEAVEIAEHGFSDAPESKMTEAKYLTAWQYLVDKKLAWSLQGWFGRTAQQLIENKLILS